MQLAKRKKKGQVRAAGLRTEKQFFGPRGVFAKSGHTKHLTNSIRSRYANFTWEQIASYLQREGWKPLAKKNVYAFSRLIGDLFQVLQLEAHDWRVLYRTSLTAGADQALSLGVYKNLDSALIAANRQANDRAKKNPGEAWHAGMAIVARRYGQKTKEPVEKAMFKGIEVAHLDSGKAARRLKMNRQKERVLRPRKNPLAVFAVGNPPRSVRANVEGVIYSRCLEIRAEKTKFKPGLYRHPFSRKAGVQILALDTGDLLVHSTRGVNLWEPV